MTERDKNRERPGKPEKPLAATRSKKAQSGSKPKEGQVKVFLSWSGQRSKSLALCTKEFLSCVMQDVQLWMSDADMDLGKRWCEELAKELSKTDCGIAFVTPENKVAPWLIFEAGALAKSIGSARLIPLLFGMSTAELPPPMSQFQASRADKEGIHRLALAINTLTNSAVLQGILEKRFEMFWPHYEKKVVDILDDLVPSERRAEREVLEEVLGILRRLDRLEYDVSIKRRDFDINNVKDWLRTTLQETQEDITNWDSTLKFHSERSAGTTIPNEIVEEHRELRRREIVLQEVIKLLDGLG